MTASSSDESTRFWPKQGLKEQAIDHESDLPDVRRTSLSIRWCHWDPRKEAGRRPWFPGFGSSISYHSAFSPDPALMPISLSASDLDGQTGGVPVVSNS